MQACSFERDSIPVSIGTYVDQGEIDTFETKNAFDRGSLISVPSNTVRERGKVLLCIKQPDRHDEKLFFS